VWFPSSLSFSQLRPILARCQFPACFPSSQLVFPVSTLIRAQPLLVFSLCPRSASSLHSSPVLSSILVQRFASFISSQYPVYFPAPPIASSQLSSFVYPVESSVGCPVGFQVFLHSQLFNPLCPGLSHAPLRLPVNPLVVVSGSLSSVSASSQLQLRSLS
jgi:hypothetical protein